MVSGIRCTTERIAQSLDINDAKDRVIQYRKLIAETIKRRDVLEQKVAKFGELHSPTHIIVEYNDAIKEIENYQESIIECKSQVTQYLENEIRKSVGHIDSWRIVLKGMLKDRQRAVKAMELLVTSDDFDNVDLFRQELQVVNNDKKRSVTPSAEQRMEEIYKLVLNIKSLREQIADVQTW